MKNEKKSLKPVHELAPFDIPSRFYISLSPLRKKETNTMSDYHSNEILMGIFILQPC